MILPCRHGERITGQVQPAVDLLSNLDVLHPDVLFGITFGQKTIRVDLYFGQLLRASVGHSSPHQ